jgi:HD-like signal output (HDOD) protein
MQKVEIENSILSLVDVKFPLLPSAILEINSVLDNPKASIEDLTTVLTKNPSLVVRILQVANSPAIGMSKEIVSISQAISVLGMSYVRNLVLCVTLKDLFSSTREDLSKIVFDVWHRSVEISIVAALLAKQFNRNADSALVAGLLHEIGTLPIVDFYNRHALSSDTLNDVILDLEKTVGQALLARWDFPRLIIESMHDENSFLNRVVKAAYYIFDEDESRLELLGISVEDFNSVVDKQSLKDSESSLL